MKVIPTGGALGARIEGLDLSRPLKEDEVKGIVRAVGEHGVICIPDQKLEPVHLKAFSGNFGELEVNVASSFQEKDHPEIMILSNMREDGKPIGFADAGQDWHTDMSYSSTVAFANILYGIKIPRRDGRPLGCTAFCDMHKAYEMLPDDIKRRIDGRTATHDFNKFWEKMRREKGSARPPLTEEQRRKKPPVSHPMVMAHPITGRSVLYANPGYTVSIDGMPAAESDEILEFLFTHQIRPEFQHQHLWTENDVLMWDNFGTIHNAIADYGPDEHRLIKRCQVMADKVLADTFGVRPVH
ncbi:TauD/TfdA family dioxygenase [Pseudaminobacter arsenicus]|uniref:TauD/TfdA family dioxygenase n=2 Tax=Borborobacter arsenicus TaxID=1851146 RepID=A0A432V3C2_9HYPH|nr:TauD/TfdA family dioxygenase [Pseudaminobacter arsenicus]